jgi:hypothetical protein
VSAESSFAFAIVQPALTPWAALEVVRAELKAMASNEVIRKAPVDAAFAVEIAESASISLVRHRPALEAEVGPRATERLESLVVSARALKQAHLLHQQAKVWGEFAAERADLRERYRAMLDAGRTLATRGLLRQAELRPKKSIQGYRGLADAVLVLATLFRTRWEELGPSSAVTLEEVEAAARVAQDLIVALAYRDHQVDLAAAADLRDRAMTRLFRDYEEVRRMVTFVRWYERDADELAPSFFAARARRSRRSKKSARGTAKATRLFSQIDAGASNPRKPRSDEDGARGKSLRPMKTGDSL